MTDLKPLILPLKEEYFRLIEAGVKGEEYRLCTPHWQQRLVGRRYSKIVLTLGYPKKDDVSRRVERPWRGYVRKTITHHTSARRP